MEEDLNQELKTEELTTDNSEEPAISPSQSLTHATTDIPEIWGSGTKSNTVRTGQAIQNVRKSLGLRSTTHGMYAGVPMICKGLQCPFYETCWIEDADLVVGDRCPIEIATIMEQYRHYVKELSIEDSNKVDQGLVKQLIDVEILMLRTDNKMAMSSDVVRTVVDAVNQRTGDVYYKTDIDPVLNLKNDLRKEHHRILTNLQATRKDKKDSLLGRQDPSSLAANLVARYRQFQDQQAAIVVEAETVEVPSSEEVSE